MGFLETSAALLAFVAIGGIAGYFWSGGKPTPDQDTADDVAGIANAQYAKPRHLTDYGITDDED